MTDFFADLERQLVIATADRSRRVRRARTRRSATLATVLLAVLAGGAGLATALSGGDDDGVSAAPTATTAPAGTLAPSPVQHARGSFTVSVLNGTTVPGLGRGVANRLQNARFKIGNVTNAADQTRATTVVEYLPGRRADAAAVAESIDAPANALRPADHASRAIAGAQAQVIVIVGGDQDTSPHRR